MKLFEIWRRIATTRYARELESEVSRMRGEIARERAENSRLRAENRALLNSILGIAGIPPVLVPDPPDDPALPDSLPLDSSSSPSLHREKGKGNAFAPHRRRSWHQVMRGLELASARKNAKEES